MSAKSSANAPAAKKKQKAKPPDFVAPTKIFLTQVRRLRIPKSLPTPGAGGFTWAKSQPQLRHFGPAEQVRRIIESQVWGEIMTPVLDSLDRKRFAGPACRFTSNELEALCVYEKLAGFTTTKDCLLHLEGPRYRRERATLGFDHVRSTRAEILEIGLGVLPNESTLSRHRTRLGDKRRAELWEKLLERFADEDLSEVDDEELRILHIDGTHVPVVYTCPVVKEGTAEIVNADKVTCNDGGVLPRNSHGKGAHGFAVVAVWTAKATRIGHVIVRISRSEKTLGPKLIETITPRIQSLRAGATTIGVLTADSAYATAAFRRAVRSIGYIENTHHVSHAHRDRSKRNAAARNQDWIRFEDNENWGTNGHFELLCICGRNRNERVFALRGTGAKQHVVPRVESSCPEHGTFTLTSGKWVLGSSKKWRVYDPFNDPRYDEDAKNARLAAGNSLTFNDPLAALFGQLRWALNEGIHGTLATRWKLTFGKRFFKNIDQVRIEAAMVFTSMHVCAIERRRVEAESTAPAPLAA